MSDTVTTAEGEAALAQEEQEATTAFPCESCGESRATYVLADLEKADTSLFCGKCLVLTFAKVANDMFAEQQ